MSTAVLEEHLTVVIIHSLRNESVPCPFLKQGTWLLLQRSGVLEMRHPAGIFTFSGDRLERTRQARHQELQLPSEGKRKSE